MARINVPPSEYATLRDFAELPDSAFSEFVSGLTEIEPAIKQLDFSDVLAQKSKSVAPADLKAFLRTFFSLYRIMEVRGKSAEVVAADLKETIEREKPNNFPLQKVDVLRERVQKILSIGGAVSVVAKAANVLGEQERVFLSARVMSDIRPVFSDQPDSVSGAVVTHSLNIHYHEEGKHRDFFVALAANDLQELKKVIERAERKSATLKSLIEKLAIRYFETE
jgi:hypothetical protein